MITYNHEEFIAKAIDSVLMQKTNFYYEIVIGEDCSTDNTRKIILEYQERYPNKFRLFLNERNLGAHKNATQVHQACRGEYIALLEGDDYWTSPDKLQKEVDFLDCHPECAICFHNALIVYDDGSREPSLYRPHQKELSTVEDLLLDNYIPTCSVMFRRGLFDRIPDWVLTLEMGDWPIHIFNALHGKIGYINEIMGIYVVHRGGVWSSKNQEEEEKAINQFYEALSKHLEPKYTRIIDRILSHRFLALAEIYEDMGDLSKARAYAIKSLRRHFLIISERLRHGNKGDLSNLIPYYLFRKSATLFKSLLRLYMIPILRSNTPILYKFLRSSAKLRNLNLRLKNIFRV